MYKSIRSLHGKGKIAGMLGRQRAGLFFPSVGISLISNENSELLRIILEICGFNALVEGESVSVQLFTALVIRCDEVILGPSLYQLAVM